MLVPPIILKDYWGDQHLSCGLFLSTEGGERNNQREGDADEDDSGHRGNRQGHSGLG